MTLTDTTLAEIEAAARAATEPGDWSADENIIWSNGRGVPVADVRIGTPVWYKGPALPYEANARFITLACNNAAAMVEEIRALRERVAELERVKAVLDEALTMACDERDEAYSEFDKLKEAVGPFTWYLSSSVFDDRPDDHIPQTTEDVGRRAPRLGDYRRLARATQKGTSDV